MFQLVKKSQKPFEKSFEKHCQINLIYLESAPYLRKFESCKDSNLVACIATSSFKSPTTLPVKQLPSF